eukprot:TRINITY_DN2786_c0_g1_i2.p1 TRINITY_DN2786_c0_g1~~TRINITY_DN2786_c0_g1_i2.p1  ORF type:complete len:481 (+),score=83.21 TRINITY_DN2786_c0_g1_i2:66-1445(+)
MFTRALLSSARCPKSCCSQHALHHSPSLPTTVSPSPCLERSEVESQLRFHSTSPPSGEEPAESKIEVRRRQNEETVAAKREENWICGECSNTNFSWRGTCNRCHTPISETVLKKIGEWTCRSCKSPNHYLNKDCVSCNSPRFSNNARTEPAARRDSDWTCSSCSTVNFSRRVTCFSCGEGISAAEMERRGDWVCEECLTINFKGRFACFQCKTRKDGTKPESAEEKAARRQKEQLTRHDHSLEKSGRGSSTRSSWVCASCQTSNPPQKRKCGNCNEYKWGKPAEFGDLSRISTGGWSNSYRWNCSTCDYANASSAERCTYCAQTLRPPRQANQNKGEWYCKSCNSLNFSTRITCFKCNEKAPNPVEPAVHMEDVRPDDWICKECNSVNFKKNRKCRGCSADARSSGYNAMEVLKAMMYEEVAGGAKAKRSADGKVVINIPESFKPKDNNLYGDNFNRDE